MDILGIEETAESNEKLDAVIADNINTFAATGPTVIKVVGCGGGGSSAVNRMITHNIGNVEFIVLNTDLQALSRSTAKTRIPIGQKLTKGLGAGGNPEVGEKAAEEDKETISKILKGADMVFITAGMGGGTGTGSAPVVAQIAKELGCLTIAVVTTPFKFEGNIRMQQASEGLKKLHDQVDSLIVIPNEQLFKNFDKNLTVRESFKKADEILCQGVEGISNIITNPGDVNTDFADVRNAMSGQGNAIFGVGVAEGENRAVEAASKAINNPMLENSRIDGAKNLLINICSSEEITLNEVGEICNIVTASADRNYNMFWGQVTQPELGDKISVTVIATGFENKGQAYSSAKEVMPEPVQKINDPGIINPDEFKLILNNDVPVKSSEPKENVVPEFNFDAASIFETNEKTEKAEKTENTDSLGWGNELLKENDLPMSAKTTKRSFAPPAGYTGQNDLSQPAIWSNPEFGRSISLSDD